MGQISKSYRQAEDDGVDRSLASYFSSLKTTEAGGEKVGIGNE